MSPAFIRFALLVLAACSKPTPPAPQARVPSPPVATPALAEPRAAETLELRFGEPSHPLPEGAPAGLAYLPPNFDRSAPYDLVVFLHGWSGCIEVLMRSGPRTCRAESEDERPGWGLGATLSAAQRVVLMPQLAFRRRDGDAGRFEDPVFTLAWFESALEQLELSTPRRTALVPHSAGFESALAWTQSNVPIDAIFLMDALYAKTQEFFAWAQADASRMLVSYYTGGSTGQQSRRLERMAAREEIPVERVRRVRTRARHAEVPAVEGPAALREFFEGSHGGGGVTASD